MFLIGMYIHVFFWINNQIVSVFWILYLRSIYSNCLQVYLPKHSEFFSLQKCLVKNSAHVCQTGMPSTYLMYFWPPSKKWPEKLRRYAPTKGNQEKADRIIYIMDLIDMPQNLKKWLDIYYHTISIRAPVRAGNNQWGAFIEYLDWTETRIDQLRYKAHLNFGVRMHYGKEVIRGFCSGQLWQFMPWRFSLK